MVKEKNLKIPHILKVNFYRCHDHLNKMLLQHTLPPLCASSRREILSKGRVRFPINLEKLYFVSLRGCTIVTFWARVCEYYVDVASNSHHMHSVVLTFAHWGSKQLACC